MVWEIVSNALPGMMAFYKGIAPRLGKISIGQAITFTAYEARPLGGQAFNGKESAPDLLHCLLRPDGLVRQPHIEGAESEKHHKLRPNQRSQCRHLFSKRSSPNGLRVFSKVQVWTGVASG